MTVQSNLLAQDELRHQLSEPQERPHQPPMQVPSGYASWHAWLSGKALPLVTNSRALPGQVVQLAREGVQSYQAMELLRHLLLLGFLLLVVAAYLTRTHAVDPARGFWRGYSRCWS